MYFVSLPVGVEKSKKLLMAFKKQHFSKAQERAIQDWAEQGGAASIIRLKTETSAAQDKIAKLKKERLIISLGFLTLFLSLVVEVVRVVFLS